MRTGVVGGGGGGGGSRLMGSGHWPWLACLVAAASEEMLRLEVGWLEVGWLVGWLVGGWLEVGWLIDC